MGFSSQDSSLELSYSKKDCFSASKSALEKVKFKITSENELLGVIQADVKAGFTSYTWGDVITITITENKDGSCKMLITSTAKVASLMAGKQQSKNITIFTNALTFELKKFQELSLDSSQVEAKSIADEIKKFKELLDVGAITEEEFETQKKKLLSM